MSILHTSQEPQSVSQSSTDVTETVVTQGGCDRSLTESTPPNIDGRGFFRSAVLKRLERIPSGQLTVVDHFGAREFGQVGAAGLAATITVHDPRFYRAVVLGGALGAAESYIRGDWDSPDLIAVMRVFSQNASALASTEKGIPQLIRPFRVATNWVRRNSRAGSRRNIAAHYDLSNEFFALMLDATMTYSSGVFCTPTSTLEEASIEKYEQVCRKLQLTAEDHVLEIGTGWGGFAAHAAKNYGCRVTTTTISTQQHDYAEQRFREASLQDRITLLKDDYRDLRGVYDKLVSVEMIEAVGEKFLPEFFAQCSRLLRPDGMMLLQSITMPDHRYEQYRHSVDFIQRYIFPGGFLPSIGAIADCLGRVTDIRLFHIEEFGTHYAETLSRWRNNFWNNMDQVKSIGFDERFVRTWHYYLCYCEAGFRERQIGVSQIVLTKPACRRASLISTALF